MHDGAAGTTITGQLPDHGYIAPRGDVIGNLKLRCRVIQLEVRFVGVGVEDEAATQGADLS